MMRSLSVAISRHLCSNALFRSRTRPQNKFVAMEREKTEEREREEREWEREKEREKEREERVARTKKLSLAKQKHWRHDPAVTLHCECNAL